jgi:hypothetical protein
MAKDAYLRDGMILFSDAGAFRNEQRTEPVDRLTIRLDRLNNELCALPFHPQIAGLRDQVHVSLFNGEITEICTMLMRTVLILKGHRG